MRNDHETMANEMNTYIFREESRARAFLFSFLMEKITRNLVREIYILSYGRTAYYMLFFFYFSTVFVFTKSGETFTMAAERRRKT